MLLWQMFFKGLQSKLDNSQEAVVQFRCFLSLRGVNVTVIVTIPALFPVLGESDDPPHVLENSP
jgi:hypothetical protein